MESKDGFESIYAYITLESAIFALILSNVMPEGFITASFQTDDQNRINEINKHKMKQKTE